MIGATGLEPATCRRGDRASQAIAAVRPVRALSLARARAGTPRSVSRTALGERSPTAFRVALPENDRRYAGSVDRQYPRTIRCTGGQFSRFGARRRKTHSGRQDSNLRPVAAATVLAKQSPQFVASAPCL